MKFKQIDRIISWQSGQQIVAARTVHAGESILEDHFPRFPVLPGVLMLEACFQAGMFLVLATDDFRRPWVTLLSVRNAKYSDFVTPGQTLTVTMDVAKQDEKTTTFKAKGVVAGPDKEPSNAFAAKMILGRARLEEAHPEKAPSTGAMRSGLKNVFEGLTKQLTQ